MTNRIHILLFLAGILIFGSCSKEQVLERRLRGNWDLSRVSEQRFINGSLESESITFPEAIIELKDDKTGLITHEEGEINLTWDNEKFEVILDGPGGPVTFDVIENGRKEQVWRRSSSHGVSGAKISITITWELTSLD